MSNIERLNFPDVSSPGPDHVTKEEYQEIRSYLSEHGRNQEKKDRNALLVHLLWYLAARVSDVLSLQTGDFDFSKGIVKLTVKKSGRLVRPRQRRSETPSDYTRRMEIWKPCPPRILEFPISPELGMEVLAFSQKYRTRTGRLMDLTRQQAWNIISDAGIHAIHRTVWPHQFRHGAAMHLMASNRNTYEIQAWLGHSSPEITFKTYARMTVAMKRQTAKESGLE